MHAVGSVLKVQISLPSSVACASIVRIIGVGMGKKYKWNMHKLSQIQIVYEEQGLHQLSEVKAASVIVMLSVVLWCGVRVI